LTLIIRGVTALGGEMQAERLETAYQQTEQMRRGGTFPFGFGRRWHSGGRRAMENATMLKEETWFGRR